MSAVPMILPERHARWLQSEPTTQVLNALEAKGGGDCARFVGGCVRNSLIGRPVDDIDIATRLHPAQVIDALEAAGLKAIPTGLDHGTVTALALGRTFEITTLRQDVETDGRHAVVAFTTEWEADAARRDFRFNALYADAAGRIFDPTGHGVADALDGRVVFVGDPETRIREDYLRILRFFRFQAWYGRGEPDPDSLTACTRMKGGLAVMSAERIAKELLKLLAAEDPRGSIRLMAAGGLLSSIVPGCLGIHGFDRLVEIEAELMHDPDALLRLSALVPADATVMIDLSKHLRLSNLQRDRLVSLSAVVPRIVPWMSPKEVRQAVYQIGTATFIDRVKLGWARNPRKASHSQWRALLPLGQSWTVPKFPLTGEAAIAAGVPQGPLVGAVLAEVEAWWIDNDFAQDPLSMIERLKAVAQGMAY